MKAFDVPTPEELRNLKKTGYHEQGIRNQGKDQLEMNQLGLKHICTWKQC
jgi:hypothetical protein